MFYFTIVMAMSCTSYSVRVPSLFLMFSLMFFNLSMKVVTWVELMSMLSSWAWLSVGFRFRAWLSLEKLNF